MAKSCAIEDVCVTQEGHLRFRAFGKEVQMGYVCHERDEEVRLGSVNLSGLGVEIAPYAKGPVDTDEAQVAAMFEEEMASYEARMELHYPGFRLKYPRPTETGVLIMFMVSSVAFRASATVDGEPTMSIVSRVDYTKSQTVLASDKDGVVKTLTIPADGPHSIGTSGVAP